MNCSKCGKEISETQKFCPYCGQMQYSDVHSSEEPVVETAQEAAEEQTEQRSPEFEPGMGPLKSDWNFVWYIVLSIVTCGIYSLYVLHCVSRDVNIACDGDGESTPGIVQYILLSIVTCGIYSFYYFYKLGNRLWANAPRYRMEFQETGTTILLWDIIGALICGIGTYVAMYFLLKNTNAICEAYNEYVMR